MGGRRITDETIAAIKQLLLKGGLSDYKIASLIGISRTSVALIRQRADRPKPARREEIRFETVPEQECPGCKHMIVLSPCVECLALKKKKDAES